MTKCIIIDSRMRNIEKQFLKYMGYILIEIEKSNNVYPEISSHVDIFCTKINETLFLEPHLYDVISKKGFNMENIICGSSTLKLKYPYDVAYNVCQIGKNIIHNFKYTDTKILEYIEKSGINKINIKQGYSNCSIAVIDLNSAIVTDKVIAKELEKNNIDVLCLENDLDIKLYSKNGKYSNMKGFIGGCISRLEDKVVVFGDLNKFNECEKIREFIKSKNLELIDFKELDIIDYGGIVDIN